MLTLRFLGAELAAARFAELTQLLKITRTVGVGTPRAPVSIVSKFFDFTTCKICMHFESPPQAVRAARGIAGGGGVTDRGATDPIRRRRTSDCGPLGVPITLQTSPRRTP